MKEPTLNARDIRAICQHYYLNVAANYPVGSKLRLQCVALTNAIEGACLATLLAKAMLPADVAVAVGFTQDEEPKPAVAPAPQTGGGE
jgi:hypothetical protein